MVSMPGRPRALLSISGKGSTHSARRLALDASARVWVKLPVPPPKSTMRASCAVEASHETQPWCLCAERETEGSVCSKTPAIVTSSGRPRCTMQCDSTQLWYSLEE